MLPSDNLSVSERNQSDPTGPDWGTQEDGVRAVEDTMATVESGCQSALDVVLVRRPNPTWKRGFDLVASALLLVLLSPLLVAIALVIKLTSRGPVFFKQSRHGHQGETFLIWKFRTLRHTVDGQQHQHHVKQLVDSGHALKKIDNATEYIVFGRQLRLLALDELPQLINVLRGEMSLVGPRPDVLTLDDYQPWQLARFEVLPGLTGLWQVSGKNKTTFDEMMALDIDYVKRRSLRLDLFILLRTVPALIRQALEGED